MRQRNDSAAINKVPLQTSPYQQILRFPQAKFPPPVPVPKINEALDVSLKVKPQDIDSAQSRPRREQAHDSASLLLVMDRRTVIHDGSKNDHDDEGN